jgi:hypothetical protein
MSFFNNHLIGDGKIASDYLLFFNPAIAVYDGANKTTGMNLGSGYVAGQSTASKRPVYNATGWDGKPCITFDGLTQSLVVPFTLALSEFTVKIVARTSKNTGLQTLMEKTLSFGFRYTTNYTTHIGNASNPWNNVASNIGGLVIGTKYLSSTRYRSGELRTSHNQDIAPAKTTITGAVDASIASLSFGGGGSGSTNYFAGDVAAIYFWPRFLEDTESLETNYALRAQYGITF